MTKFILWKKIVGAKSQPTDKNNDRESFKKTYDTALTENGKNKSSQQRILIVCFFAKDSRKTEKRWKKGKKKQKLKSSTLICGGW